MQTNLVACSCFCSCARLTSGPAATLIAQLQYFYLSWKYTCTAVSHRPSKHPARTTEHLNITAARHTTNTQVQRNITFGDERKHTNMGSHYQAYLKAVQDDSSRRTVSSPTPSTIARKPTNRSITPVIASPGQPGYNAPSTPVSTHQRTTVSLTPTSTAPSSVANFPQPPATPLASHPPDPPQSKNPNLKDLTSEQVSIAFTTILALLKAAVTEHDKRPFAAVLLGPDNTTQLLTHFSISPVRRAETELARLAAEQYSTTYLSKCTLVTAWDPCPMSAGTIYLSGIGRVLYAAGESKLKDLLPNNEEALSLSCRTIFNSGSRDVEVIGPVLEWEGKIVSECSMLWKKQQMNGHGDSLSKSASIRSTGTGGRERLSTVQTWTPEDSMGLSSIGEDGEYKADLDIDWMN